jgi:hypothetical protein
VFFFGYLPVMRCLTAPTGRRGNSPNHFGQIHPMLIVFEIS